MWEQVLSAGLLFVKVFFIYMFLYVLVPKCIQAHHTNAAARHIAILAATAQIAKGEIPDYGQEGRTQTNKEKVN